MNIHICPEHATDPQPARPTRKPMPFARPGITRQGLRKQGLPFGGLRPLFPALDSAPVPCRMLSGPDAEASWRSSKKPPMMAVRPERAGLAFLESNCRSRAVAPRRRDLAALTPRRGSVSRCRRRSTGRPARGGQHGLDDGVLRRTAERTFEDYGFYGVPMFVALELPVEQLCADVEEVRRYERIRMSTVGRLRQAGFALLSTGRRPHFDIALPDLADLTLEHLRMAFGAPMANPGR